MAQISLKEYLKILLEGTKDYIDDKNDSQTNIIKNNYGIDLAELESKLMAVIDALDKAYGVVNAEQNLAIEALKTKDIELGAKIDPIIIKLPEKVDKTYLVWATYDETNKILQIGVPGSAYYLKSTTTALEIYNGSTKLMYFEGGHLTATDITTSNSMTTPKITVGGLEISGNSTNGWSFR